MADFIHQRKVLEELVKAREAVKRKYNLVKTQKDDTERVVHETFKPIIHPIQQLVELKKNKRSRFKENSNESSELQPSDNEDLENLEDNSRHYTLDSTIIDSRKDDYVNNIEDTSSSLSDIEEGKNTIIKNVKNNFQDANSSFETADEEEGIDDDVEEGDEEIPLVGSEIDKIYGVKKSKDGYMIGSAHIQFKKDNIIVNGEPYPRTPGLYDIILFKDPKNYSPDDLTLYDRILDVSNVHRCLNNPNGELKKHSNSNKFKNIILPLFEMKQKRSPLRLFPKSTSKIGGGVPRFKIAKHNTQMDYIYWDDPNELVDRLRFLIAENFAGNTNHNNEILSIIEELREGGFIY